MDSAGLPTEPPPGVPRLASWGRRLAAVLLDDVVVLIPAAVGIGLIAVDSEADELGPVGIGGFVVLILAITVGQALYFTILHGRTGQTVGKRALAIKVIDEGGGGPIGYGRAFGRWLIPFVLGLFCGLLNVLDGLWPLWDARNQTWHDKAANSVVVRVLD